MLGDIERFIAIVHVFAEMREHCVDIFLVQDLRGGKRGLQGFAGHEAGNTAANKRKIRRMFANQTFCEAASSIERISAMGLLYLQKGAKAKGKGPRRHSSREWSGVQLKSAGDAEVGVEKNSGSFVMRALGESWKVVRS